LLEENCFVIAIFVNNPKGIAKSALEGEKFSKLAQLIKEKNKLLQINNK
jgi:hypothetical protein